MKTAKGKGAVKKEALKPVDDRFELFRVLIAYLLCISEYEYVPKCI